jgi:flagellar hook-associated protein 2
VGSAVLAGTTLISNGVDDTLQVNVDGIIATVTLAAGSYTPAALAAEIQSKINSISGVAATGSGVTVTLQGGALTVTSNRYGAVSVLQLLGGTALSPLFGTVDATNAAGLDVAGTIGGQTATGDGQTLTATGLASGLKIQVQGSTTGDRGSVNYVEGIASRFGTYFDQLLKAEGTLSKRTQGLTASVKGLDTKRQALSRHLEQVEKRYRAQFSALDVLISRMSQTSNFLTQQLASLSKNNP